MTGLEHGGDFDGLADLGSGFARIAAVLRTSDGDAIDPDRLVQTVATAMSHVEHCAVTVVRGRGKPTTLASTGPVARQVDELQYATGEGPCLDASRSDGLVRVDDLRGDDRWPLFAARCVEETSIVSVLSARLSLGGEDRAALNLYTSRAQSFDELDEGVASVLAPFAALSVQTQMRRADAVHFDLALGSSRRIGRAVGIVMHQRQIDADEAFALIRQASQHLNRKLRDIADEVEYTGQLPSANSA